MTFDLFVNYVSLVLSGFAVAVNVWAARSGNPKLRPIYATMATLAVMYHGSFYWLVAHAEDAATWSRWLRPVGAVSWVGAWSHLSIASVLSYRARLRHEAAARTALTEVDRVNA